MCYVSHVCVFPYVGIISANGEAGGTSSGGASGGSVWIETNGFHGNGRVHVNGGAGTNRKQWESLGRNRDNVYAINEMEYLTWSVCIGT